MLQSYVPIFLKIFQTQITDSESLDNKMLMLGVDVCKSLPLWVDMFWKYFELNNSNFPRVPDKSNTGQRSRQF